MTSFACAFTAFETPPASAGGTSISKLQTASSLLGHHQALAGGVSTSQLNKAVTRERLFACCSYEVEVPPAEAWWCPRAGFGCFCSYEVEVPPAEAGGVLSGKSSI